MARVMMRGHPAGSGKLGDSGLCASLTLVVLTTHCTTIPAIPEEVDDVRLGDDDDGRLDTV